MIQVPEHIDLLIAKHHDNQLSEQERLMLLEWIDASEEHMRAFTASVKVLGRGREQEQEREREREGEREREKVKRLVLMGLAVAAVVVIGILLFTPNMPLSEEFMAFDAPMERRFDDSTDVLLQPQSALSFTQKSKHHSVYTLSKGAAKFEMHKQPEQTIQVVTSDVTITDIGTTFYVENQGDSLIYIHVVEGRVECSTPIVKQDIRANEKYRYSVGKKRFESMNPKLPNVHSADVLQFHFENTALRDVIAQLSDAYNVNITLSGAIGDCSISVDFDQEELPTILAVLCETLNLTLAINDHNESYILSGNGCD